MPSANNVDEMIDAPFVVVEPHVVTVDGAMVGSVAAITGTGGTAPLPELTSMLKAKRDFYRAYYPQRPTPRQAILVVDEGMSAEVVKTVFGATAAAGFTDVSFAVGRLPAP